MMKKNIFCALAMAATLVCPGAKAETGDTLTMIVGSYTESENDEGIYVYRFNQNDGTASKVSSVKAGNPSYIALGKGGDRIYSVNEYGDGRQAASAFKFDRDKGTLSFINSQPTREGANGDDWFSAEARGEKPKTHNSGADPCFVLAGNGFIATANYTGGDVSLFPTFKDGSLMAQSQHFDFFEGEPTKQAHLHCVRPTPDGKYLLACDLGNDCLYRFELRNDTTDAGEVYFVSSPEIAFKGEKGSGPRHITFSPDGQHAYLLNELNGHVCVFDYSDGKLTLIQDIPAKPEDGPGSADIHLTPDGKFLYASRRLKDNGITIFAIDGKTGKARRVGYQPTGMHPRNFNITPNGKYLLAACRDDNVIETYKIDPKTGLLEKTGEGIKLHKPVCIIFAEQEIAEQQKHAATPSANRSESQENRTESQGFSTFQQPEKNISGIRKFFSGLLQSISVIFFTTTGIAFVC